MWKYRLYHFKSSVKEETSRAENPANGVRTLSENTITLKSMIFLNRKDQVRRIGAGMIIKIDSSQ